MKVLLMPKYMNAFVQQLRKKHPGVEFIEAYSPDVVSKHITDAEVIFGNVSPENYKKAQALKWIQTGGAGVESLLTRVPEIIDSEIIVTNARGAGAPIIGEHAVALMFALARQFPRFEQDRRDHHWDPDGALEVVEYLGDKTVGILGFGKSGREAAWRCKALGMKVLAMDMMPVDGDPIVEDVWGIFRLPDLLRESDYVVVTAPYTSATHGMIGERELGMMKRTARIIVTSRGRIVDQVALIKALKEGTIAGAGLDTVYPEPLLPDDPLWDAPNLIITPHIAGNAEQELLDKRTFVIFDENMLRYRSGYPMLNIVGKKRGF